MITYTSFSSIGDREINEDSYICLNNGVRYCFVLADGLGGHGKGEVASDLVIKTFQTAFEQWKEESIEVFLNQTILKAQTRLLEEQKKTKSTMDMKTTLVVLCFDGNDVCWVHVGDSRLYAFQKNMIKHQTLDHSVPQMLVLAGEIKEKQIRKHPDRNRLLQVMGIDWEEPQYELDEKQELSEFQAFLLCSDGFWEWIEEKKMCSTLKKSKTVEEWQEKMLKIVHNKGKKQDKDNCTAITIFCS